MEHYNKEKHHDLVVKHIKQAVLESRDLGMHSMCDNYGNMLTELVINETDSILMTSREFQQIWHYAFDEIINHHLMTDYIAAVDESARENQYYHREIQGTTASTNIPPWRRRR